MNTITPIINAAIVFGVHAPAAPTNSEADGITLLDGTAAEVETVCNWTDGYSEESPLETIDSVEEVKVTKVSRVVGQVSPAQEVVVNDEELVLVILSDLELVIKVDGWAGVFGCGTDAVFKVMTEIVEIVVG